jgi:hypothetical protein
MATRKHYMVSKKWGRKIRPKTASRKVQNKNGADNDTIWGKNKPLEKFWHKLASGKYVVIIYKNGKHKYMKMPNPGTQQASDLYNRFDQDEEIEAVLSSSISTDTYQEFLYPKAKNESVENVINNYKKYFESIEQIHEEGKPQMKKVMVP